MSAAVGLLLLAALGPLDAQPPRVEIAVEIALEPVASGFDRPVGIVPAGDGSGRLFVVEQSGAVRVLRAGALLPAPFLDLSGQVSCCGERGLLGLAFHPRFPADGRLFVDYTDAAGDTRIVEYRVSAADPDRADPGSARPLLAVAQPFPNHNGGALAFGPDGFLYVGLGDGGSGGDPLNHAQNPASLLGKVLRLDVDRAEAGLAYGIPPGNALFPGTPGARPEIWALGLRNPWRFAFDRETGDLFIGDVGQNRVEEIDLLPPGSAGANLGWRLKEGTGCFQPAAGCELPGLVDPILEYSHAEGCSVTGGYRYRGAAVAALAGVYLYGDF
ncbi:MAG TPA: PQQ-dependent sugar dehydrogenase, partial [Thermoanaerobaculia bacterium]|nr:PQQ-dependent sugar dehydrogenase [Thermoanaerobaculia bacterium]